MLDSLLSTLYLWLIAPFDYAFMSRALLASLALCRGVPMLSHGDEIGRTQNGNNNAYGIFQFGQNTNAHVSQYGYGQAGITIQAGW